MMMLQKQNRPVLVRVLTYRDPEYLAKSLTRSCIRHSKDIYYTSRFADLFLSMFLTNEARVETVVKRHFATSSETPALLPKYYEFWNGLVQDITTHSAFKAKIRSLKWKSVAAGELEVITHDETFKTLFAFIGHKKMTPSKGEFHAFHTFRGFTGCTLGMSSQRSTSGDCFPAAAKAIFEDNLAEKVKVIFSDCLLGREKSKTFC